MYKVDLKNFFLKNVSFIKNKNQKNFLEFYIINQAFAIYDAIFTFIKKRNNLF